MYAVANDEVGTPALCRQVGLGAGPRAQTAIERTFIDNWAALSRAFGMGPETGRAHAVLFLAGAGMTVGEVAAIGGLDVEAAAAALGRLVEYGAAGEQCGVYTSVSDPWVWFATTVRQRARRELLPLLESVRALQGAAEDAHRTGQLCEARLARITVFSRFVDQVAKLLEKFGGAGSSRPVLSAARTMARFIF